ncbi:CDGSH iron-sulfur domain-containing protein [Candidatus Poriferisodalis sp.]|uniref:CDGSH iron-sulfur domain-containing protein n=1 Tax=Candidatus Poriferisodalis sp. TaxID=3101277 RepID=UPI003B52FA8D
MADVTVTVLNNGPLLVRGSCQIADHEGNSVADSDSVVALCRCGQSDTKPMCDGSHNQGFDGTLNPPS